MDPLQKADYDKKVSVESIYRFYEALGCITIPPKERKGYKPKDNNFEDTLLELHHYDC